MTWLGFFLSTILRSARSLKFNVSGSILLPQTQEKKLFGWSWDPTQVLLHCKWLLYSLHRGSRAHLLKIKLDKWPWKFIACPSHALLRLSPASSGQRLWNLVGPTLTQKWLALIRFSHHFLVCGVKFNLACYLSFSNWLLSFASKFNYQPSPLLLPT